MISTKGLVAVIYPGLQQPKKSYESVTSFPPYLKIVLKQLRSVTLAIFSLEKCAHTQPLFTQSLPLVPSPSGGWIFWIATQHQLGGINTLSWSYTTLLSGSRPCPQLNSMGRLQPSSYSIKLSPDLVSRVRLSLIMAVTFIMK